MAGPKQFRKNDQDARIRRLIHVLKYEGHELPDHILLERFPWAAGRLVKKLRAELNIPPPTNGGYLTKADMDKASIPYRRLKPGEFGRPRCHKHSVELKEQYEAEAQACCDALQGG